MWCAHWQPMSLQIRRPCSGTAPSHSTILVEPKSFLRSPLSSVLSLVGLGCREGKPEGTSPLGQPGAVGGRRHWLWAGPREQRAPWLPRPERGSSCPPPLAPTPASTKELRKRRDFLCPPRAGRRRLSLAVRAAGSATPGGRQQQGAEPG